MRNVAIIAGIVFALGCSAEDPGVDNVYSRGDGGTKKPSGQTTGGTTSGTTGGSTTSGNTTGGGSTSGTTSGSTTAGTGGNDAGAAETGGPVTVNAFSGTGAYTATAAGEESNTHHGGNSNAGQACLGCHTGTGAAKFAFAGTAYKGAVGTPAVKAEMRVVDATGKEIAKAYTDSSGNFWLSDVATVTAGSKTGGRDGAATKLMLTDPTATQGIDGGNCNACHAAGGATTPILL